ncbi:MAG: Response regulator receiver domain [Actinomycetota bacterium]|nr:Response regulator receiver domain [Actinomycetota bacterium]
MHAHAAVVIIDQPGPYEAVRSVLSDAGFQITGAAASLTDGIALLRHHRPDLAIVDLAVEGLAAVHALHEAAPDCALLVLSRQADLAEAVVLTGALAAIDPRDLGRLDAAVRNVRVRLDQPVAQRR